MGGTGRYQAFLGWDIGGGPREVYEPERGVGKGIEKSSPLKVMPLISSFRAGGVDYWR